VYRSDQPPQERAEAADHAFEQAEHSGQQTTDRTAKPS
jgi:hypothetical protein